MIKYNNSKLTESQEKFLKDLCSLCLSNQIEIVNCQLVQWENLGVDWETTKIVEKLNISYSPAKDEVYMSGVAINGAEPTGFKTETQRY